MHLKINDSRGQPLKLKPLRIWQRQLWWKTEMMWGLITSGTTSINDPKTPPARFDENQETYHFPTTAKESIERYITNALTSRFDQPDYKIYVGMQELRFKGFKGEIFAEELTMLKKRYADEINLDKLETQLYLFPGWR